MHLHTGTQEEMAAAAQGYLAYAGPYEVDEVNKVVTHHMTVSMNPTWLGDSEPRYVNLDGDILEIASPPIIEDGKEQNTKLIWNELCIIVEVSEGAFAKSGCFLHSKTQISTNDFLNAKRS